MLGVYRCSECGEPIFEGERYIIGSEGQAVCEMCIDNMARDELLDLLGIGYKVAQSCDPRQDEYHEMRMLEVI